MNKEKGPRTFNEALALPVLPKAVGFSIVVKEGMVISVTEADSDGRYETWGVVKGQDGNWYKTKRIG